VRPAFSRRVAKANKDRSLAPLAERRALRPASRGRRKDRAPRRRREKEARRSTADEDDTAMAAAAAPPPPPPAVKAQVTVGLNCTARALQALASHQEEEEEEEEQGRDAGRPGPMQTDDDQQGRAEHRSPARLVAVLLAGGSADSPLYARLPALAPPPVRLVVLRSAGAGKRLAVALGVPRVGVLGLAEGLLGVEALLAGHGIGN
jgi:hypothetical protein